MYYVRSLTSGTGITHRDSKIGHSLEHQFGTKWAGIESGILI